MNYIKRLEMENKQKEAELQEMKNQIIQLRKHMQSKKFHCGDDLDNYINVQEVDAMLTDMVFSASEAGVKAVIDFE